jgi:hypothetical protein
MILQKWHFWTQIATIFDENMIITLHTNFSRKLPMLFSPKVDQNCRNLAQIAKNDDLSIDPRT